MTLVLDLLTQRLDKDTFISYFFTTLIAFILTQVPAIPFIPLALMLLVLRFTLLFFLFNIIGIRFGELFFEHGIGFFVNLITILAIGTILTFAGITI